jgi:hypothetical protein
MKRVILCILLFPLFAYGEGGSFSGGGLSRVKTSSAFTGSGTNASPLDLTNSCAPTQVLQWSGSAWACATVSGGGGLSGGTTGALPIWTSSTTIGSFTGSSPSACAAGQSVSGETLSAGGVLSQTCSTTVSSVSAGSDITTSTTNGIATISVDETAAQHRVSGTCADPTAILSIAQNGTVTCSSPPNSYTSTHWEVDDDYMLVTAPATASQAMLYRDWYCATNVASGFAVNVGTTTRPGILEATTQASAAGWTGCAMDQASIDFGSGTWTFEWVGGFPTLADGTNTYASVIGFNNDGISTINPTNGCWFLYDHGNVATGGVNPSNLDLWEVVCATASTRTRLLLNGTSQDGAGNAGAITTVNSPVAAETLPNTNVYHLKIVVSGGNSAVFSINGSTVATITTNIPSGTNRTGTGFNVLKSLGTTSRAVDTDFTRVAVDLTSARSP